MEANGRELYIGLTKEVFWKLETVYHLTFYVNELKIAKFILSSLSQNLIIQKLSIDSFFETFFTNKYCFEKKKMWTFRGEAAMRQVSRECLTCHSTEDVFKKYRIRLNKQAFSWKLLKNTISEGVNVIEKLQYHVEFLVIV